jgi:hypothetical protein
MSFEILELSGETVDELFAAIEMLPIGRRTNEPKRGG